MENQTKDVTKGNLTARQVINYVLTALLLTPFSALLAFQLWHFVSPLSWHHDYVNIAIIVSVLSPLYVLGLLMFAPKMVNLSACYCELPGKHKGPVKPNWVRLGIIYITLIGLTYLIFWLVRETMVGQVLILNEPWSDVILR